MHDFLKEQYEFSDYQIAQIRYTLSSILSEISKLIIMAAFVITIDKFSLYVAGAFVLCLLRSYTGGLHFHHYISCFFVSFLIMICGVCLLPLLPITKPIQILTLGICIVCNYHYAPVVSKYRPIPNGIVIKKSKKQSFLVVGIFAFILFVTPDNPYTLTGFWMIVLQSLQLVLAKYIKRRKRNDILNQTLGS